MLPKIIKFMPIQKISKKEKKQKKENDLIWKEYLPVKGTRHMVVLLSIYRFIRL